MNTTAQRGTRLQAIPSPARPGASDVFMVAVYICPCTLANLDS